jgi:hypothetical protein
VGFSNLSNSRGFEDDVDWTGPPSELCGSVVASLTIAIRNHPRPGMYSYWPGTGVVQYSVTLVGRSVLGARNHLCGWNTFWVARKRFGVILMVGQELEVDGRAMCCI